MDRADRVARDAILQRVFPDLRYGDDPDIDRYFELRKSGRVAEALYVYNHGLRVRYPDDSRRIALLNLFRRRDPRFASYHDRLLWSLYDSVADRLRGNLDALCGPLSGIPMKNTYRVLKAMETVVGMLPSGSAAALNLLDSYVSHAEVLDHRRKEIRRIRFLAGEYFAQASDREPAETDFLARARATEERKRTREQTARNFFDLSKIVFRAEDVERIEIPAALERKEDRVLAFCYRYWLAVDDPAFERSVFLYSRKYGTPHYDVFRAIKVGRARKFTDDEVLNRVSTALSSRYSYSVQGDLYMQRTWRLLKARLLGMETGSRPGEADSVTRALTAKGSVAHPEGKARKKPAAPGPADSLLRRARTSRRAALAPLGHPEAIAPLAPKGSVSDRIKRLSGRRYDVYREEFLSRARPSIHAWLTGHRIRPKGVLEDPINKAEDLIHEFLEKNYANPYMDWESSEIREKVEGMGFSVPSLDGIIALWYEGR